MSGELDINAWAVILFRDITYPLPLLHTLTHPMQKQSSNNFEQGYEGLVNESVVLVAKRLNGFVKAHPLSFCDSYQSHTL